MLEVTHKNDQINVNQVLMRKQTNPSVFNRSSSVMVTKTENGMRNEPILPESVTGLVFQEKFTNGRVSHQIRKI